MYKCYWMCPGRSTVSIWDPYCSCLAEIFYTYLLRPLPGPRLLKLNFADGTIFAGEFANGLHVGYGVLTFPDKVGLFVGLLCLEFSLLSSVVLLVCPPVFPGLLLCPGTGTTQPSYSGCLTLVFYSQNMKASLLKANMRDTVCSARPTV